MALFESYDRRIAQINKALNEVGIKDIEEDFQETLTKCREVTIDMIQHENLFNKVMGRCMKLLAPLV